MRLPGRWLEAVAVNPADLHSALEAAAHGQDTTGRLSLRALGKSAHLRVLPSKRSHQNHDGRDPAYSQCWDGTRTFSHCNKLRKADFISAKQEKANEPRSQQQNALQVAALREAHP